MKDEMIKMNNDERIEKTSCCSENIYNERSFVIRLLFYIDVNLLTLQAGVFG